MFEKFNNLLTVLICTRSIPPCCYRVKFIYPRPAQWDICSSAEAFGGTKPNNLTVKLVRSTSRDVVSSGHRNSYDRAGKSHRGFLEREMMSRKCVSAL